MSVERKKIYLWVGAAAPVSKIGIYVLFALSGLYGAYGFVETGLESPLVWAFEGREAPFLWVFLCGYVVDACMNRKKQ